MFLQSVEICHTEVQGQGRGLRLTGSGSDLAGPQKVVRGQNFFIPFNDQADSKHAQVPLETPFFPFLMALSRSINLSFLQNDFSFLAT